MKDLKLVDSTRSGTVSIPVECRGSDGYRKTAKCKFCSEQCTTCYNLKWLSMGVVTPQPEIS